MFISITLLSLVVMFSNLKSVLIFNSCVVLYHLFEHTLRNIYELISVNEIIIYIYIYILFIVYLFCHSSKSLLYLTLLKPFVC